MKTKNCPIHFQTQRSDWRLSVAPQGGIRFTNSVCLIQRENVSRSVTHIHMLQWQWHLAMNQNMLGVMLTRCQSLGEAAAAFLTHTADNKPRWRPLHLNEKTFTATKWFVKKQMPPSVQQETFLILSRHLRATKISQVAVLKFAVP